MTSQAGNSSHGFTLFEILVVVTILGILFGVMTPLFRNSYTNLELRNSYKNIAATIKHAQERAIMEEREFRVNFDRRERTYWLSYREDPLEFPARFVDLKTDAGRPRSLPEEVTFALIRANRDRKTRANYITFYPNGAADKATVRLRDRSHKSFLIETGKDREIIAFREK